MINHWFIPSWNGDHRLRADGPEACVLEVDRPTPAESEAIGKFLKVAHRKRWTLRRALSDKDKDEIRLEVSIAEAGEKLVRALKPRKQVITAVSFVGGKITVVEESGDGKVSALVKSETSTAAVTVKRPTCCCPNCIPGSVNRASDVLLAFLTDAEHRQWAEERAIIVEGGMSHHRYAVSHRNHPRAQAWGRMCYDLDDGGVMHFHDWSVPPEEEVLAVKLILEHREPWLRNEATAFAFRATDVYKNPFGDGSDGTRDAALLMAIGDVAKGFLRASERLS